jgi:hypothetical protein
MELREVLNMIDKMMENPPMRGDVALSDLRNLLAEKETDRVLNLINKQYEEAWDRSYLPDSFKDISNGE